MLTLALKLILLTLDVLDRFPDIHQPKLLCIYHVTLYATVHLYQSD